MSGEVRLAVAAMVAGLLCFAVGVAAIVGVEVALSGVALSVRAYAAAVLGVAWLCGFALAWFRLTYILERWLGG